MSKYSKSKTSNQPIYKELSSMSNDTVKNGLTDRIIEEQANKLKKLSTMLLKEKEDT